MPGNLVQEFLQTQPHSVPSKHPTTELPSTHKQSYPGTHLQAIARFHQHWRAREYAAAADYAAIAHTLALDSAHTEQAARYANARQLAHKYQALKVELHKIAWNVAVDPILEPDDPPSSEARCNMVCTPDRPELLQLPLSSRSQHFVHQSSPPPISLSTVEPEPEPHRTHTPEPSSEVESTENPTVNHPQINSHRVQPCDESHEIEKDVDVTVCCLAIPWPWRRAR